MRDTFDELGLRSNNGKILDGWVYRGVDVLKYKTIHCLADANDNGIAWVEIADFIENNPEKVFTKSL